MTAAAELTRCCSWCQAEGHGHAPGPNQTHGICPRHSDEMLATLRLDAMTKALGKIDALADQATTHAACCVTEMRWRAIAEARGLREAARLMREAMA